MLWIISWRNGPYLKAGRLARGLLQCGTPACSLGASGLGEPPVEKPPSKAWAPFSRTFIFSSTTSWSKFLLRPTTFLRWWMEWIYGWGHSRSVKPELGLNRKLKVIPIYAWMFWRIAVNNPVFSCRLNLILTLLFISKMDEGTELVSATCEFCNLWMEEWPIH